MGKCAPQGKGRRENVSEARRAGVCGEGTGDGRENGIRKSRKAGDAQLKNRNGSLDFWGGGAASRSCTGQASGTHQHIAFTWI